MKKERAVLLFIQGINTTYQIYAVKSKKSRQNRSDFVNFLIKRIIRWVPKMKSKKGGSHNWLPPLVVTLLPSQ